MGGVSWHLGLRNSVNNLVAKSGLTGMTRGLEAEFGDKGVTVNMVLPGRVHTERIEQLDAARAERTGKDMETVRKESLAGIPVGRLGKPEEFAAVAVFLMSEPASYVTGQMTRIDGGAVKGL